MNCQECKTEIKEEDIFCSKCGKKIERTEKENGLTPESLERLYNQTLVYGILFGNFFPVNSKKYIKASQELSKINPRMEQSFRELEKLFKELSNVKKKKKTRKRK